MEVETLRAAFDEYDRRMRPWWKRPAFAIAAAFLAGAVFGFVVVVLRGA